CVDCSVRALCNGGCPKDRFVVTPHGEPGLNYLCAGFKKFFGYSRRHLRRLDHLWHAGPARPAGILRPPVLRAQRGAGTGRNDPCPCGSGRKFKKCCG
ncbi:MAG: SEC-C metal-binding domain-containing protein, partial [Acidobacteriota bacterium]